MKADLNTCSEASGGQQSFLKIGPSTGLHMRGRVGGRSYFDQIKSHNDDFGKIEARRTVLRHILDVHPKGCIKLLSLPSAHWTFEHLLFNEYGHCRFVGVERDEHTFHRGIPWMPGTLQRKHLLEEKYEDGFRVMVAENASARFLKIDLATFLRIRRSDVLSLEERQRWTARFRMWSAIWLDFTGNLCGDIERSLGELAGGIDGKLPRIPFAITVMKGRESADIQNKMFALNCNRTEFIGKLIEGGGIETTIDGEHEYRSATGTNMLTVYGSVIPSVLPRSKKNAHVFALENPRHSVSSRRTRLAV